MLEDEGAHDEIEGVGLDAEPIFMLQVAPIVPCAVGVLVPPWHAHARLVRMRLRVREDVEPAADALEGPHQQEGLVPLQAATQRPRCHDLPDLEDEVGELPPVDLQRVRVRHEPVQGLAARSQLVAALLQPRLALLHHPPPVVVHAVIQGVATLNVGRSEHVIGCQEDGIAQGQASCGVQQHVQPSIQLAYALLPRGASNALPQARRQPVLEAIGANQRHDLFGCEPEGLVAEAQRLLQRG
mmetsp:Transcript_95035/g.252396  ORF Transcript_95035/g.252396 Transcript_95035/m.252396 type:complete len:241 (-) Transcript_95035:373-1095(-)